MKLSRADSVNLNNILAAASIAGVEAIVIDSGIASGMNAKNGCFIASSGVPALPQKMGLQRLNLLRQRLDLFAANPDLTIDARESERGEITSLEISAGKSKVQFRCSSTALIKAPKKINDAPVALVTVKKEQLQLVLNSVKVMSAKTISLIIRSDGETTFETLDATNDRMSVTVDDPSEWVDGEHDSVVFNYSTDIFSALFRAGMTDDGISFGVGEQGTINLIVHGHEMFIFAQVGE